MSEKDKGPSIPPTPGENKRRRLQAVEKLAARRGGKITYAGRLVVGIVGSEKELLLYDENNQFIGVDKAPLLSSHTENQATPENSADSQD